MATIVGEADYGLMTYLAQQYSGTLGTPTISAGSAAGTGATYSVNGNNMCGVVSITTGTVGLGTGPLFTLTFGNGFSFPTLAVPFFLPSGTAIASNPFSGTGNPSGASCYVGSILTAATSYKINYQFEGF